MGGDGWIRRGLRCLAGLALGAVTALLEVAFLIVAGVVLLARMASPRPRSRATARLYGAARWLTALELRRLRRFHGLDEDHEVTDRGAFGYVAVRWAVGLLGGFVLLLLAFGLTVAGSMLSAWVAGGSWSFVEDGGHVSTLTLVAISLPGAVLLYLNIMGVVGVADLERRTARRHLSPSRTDLLERRVSELAVSRAEVVQAVNDERRRIERDLHDGVQQRLVALGMLLGRARRTGDEARAADLLRQAHEESQQALNDLRDVAWRVYPTALDQLGLRDVLADLADRSSIPITMTYDLAERPPASVETVAYFVVSEAVSNAVKHSGAGRIEVAVRHDDRAVAVRVTDDGAGGADPGGRGLLGLAGRVAAMDGRFSVDSPAGGPTTIAAVLPCG